MAQEKTLSVIEEITARLAKLQEGQFTPVEEDETAEEITVVGEMTDHLKRLHTLREQIADEGKALGERVKKHLVEMERAKELLGIVRQIFWLEVNRQFPELDNKPSLGVRAPWNVGWFKPDENGSLEDFMSQFRKQA